MAKSGHLHLIERWRSPSCAEHDGKAREGMPLPRLFASFYSLKTSGASPLASHNRDALVDVAFVAALDFVYQGDGIVGI